MPADNLVRMALRGLAGVDERPPLQRHVRLLVAQAHLDGAVELGLAESGSVRCWELPPTEADLRHAAWVRRLAWDLAKEVGLRRYGSDPAQQEQWAAAVQAEVAQ